MALSDNFITLALLARLDLPGGTVRLSLGGLVKWGSDLFVPDDAIWGSIDVPQDIDEAIGDLSPESTLSLHIPGEVDLDDVFDEAILGSRVQIWQAEVTPATGTVSGTPQRLCDMLIDKLRWSPVRRTLSLEMVTRAERLFLRNRGNVAGSAHHKSIFPGEKGFDNCTDVPGQVAWGIGGAPRGTLVTGGGGGGGGPGVRFGQAAVL
jgi:hypothetical protein